MIVQITQVIGDMPDTTYMVLASIGGSVGEIPAAAMRRRGDDWDQKPFEVGEYVQGEFYPEAATTGTFFITTPEDIDVEDCA